MKRTLLLAFCTASGLLAGCSSQQEEPRPLPPAEPTHRLVPSEGAAGSYAMLKSNRLAATLAGNTLQLGNNPVTLLEKRNDTLIFQIPPTIARGKYALTLTAGGTTYTADSFAVKQWRVITYAGNGEAGFVNATGDAARFSGPVGLFRSGTTLYVVDAFNHAIRRLNLTSGAVSTQAGNGSPGNSSAMPGSCLSTPYFCVLNASNQLLVTCFQSHTFRRIVPTGLIVTTLAGKQDTSGTTDGTGTAAIFNQPGPIVLASNGDYFIGDHASGSIRRVTPTGVVTTWAGANGAAQSSGNRLSVTFPEIWGMLNLGGDTLLVSDRGRRQIRIIEGNNVRLYAGSGADGRTDGPFATAAFVIPADMRRAPNGCIFIADQGANTIRVLYPFGYVQTIAGAGVLGHVDGIGTGAQFGSPNGIELSADGKTIYVADASNHAIRRITLE